MDEDEHEDEAVAPISGIGNLATKPGSEEQKAERSISRQEAVS